jgi:hypothetical protein
LFPCAGVCSFCFYLLSWWLAFFPCCYCLDNVLNAIRKHWLNDVPSKVAVFGWRLLQGRLPTKSALQYKGILLNPHDLPCAFCVLSPEDCTHLFFHCLFTKRVWEAVFRWIGKSLPVNATYWQHFSLFGAMFNLKKGTSFSHLI